MGGRSDFLVHVPPVPSPAFAARRLRRAFACSLASAELLGLLRRFDNLVWICHIGVTGKQMPSSAPRRGWAAKPLLIDN